MSVVVVVVIPLVAITLRALMAQRMNAIFTT